MLVEERKPQRVHASMCAGWDLIMSALGGGDRG